MQARYYDPELGRFITADTIVQSPGDPQTFSRYSYAGNNPVMMVDPSGHFFFLAPIFAAIASAVSAVGSAVAAAGAYIAANAAAIATGALVGGAIGGVSAAVMGGNIGQGILTGAIGGAVFAGVAPGVSGLFKTALTGTSKVSLIGGAAVAESFTTGFLAGAAAGAASAAYSGSNIGNGALVGGIVAGTFALARDFASYTRKKMIAQSRLDPRNSSGKSAGFKGDGFKLGGGRFNPNNPNGGPSPLGGYQGGPGEIFGMSYQPGSFGDGLVEAFAGPHDFLNSWAYDPLSGNIANLNPVQKLITNFSNPTNVVIASPIVLSSVLPQAAAAGGGIIYGTSHGNIGEQIKSEKSARSGLVVK